MAIRYHLNALDDTHTANYIAHRLKMAGQASPIFTEEAIKLIFDFTRGTPREINNLCDVALLVGYSKRVEGDRRADRRRGHQGHGGRRLMVRMSDLVRGIVRASPAAVRPARTAAHAGARRAGAAPGPRSPRRAATGRGRASAPRRAGLDRAAAEPASPSAARAPSRSRRARRFPGACATSCAPATRSLARAGASGRRACRVAGAVGETCSGWPTMPPRRRRRLPGVPPGAGGASWRCGSG